MGNIQRFKLKKNTSSPPQNSYVIWEYKCGVSYTYLNYKFKKQVLTFFFNKKYTEKILVKT